MIAALADRRPVRVLACEARPLLQGARLTVWELGRLGIEHALVVDAAAAGLIRGGEVDAVVTGFDRVAANGDVANKVGTYGLALAADAAGIPFVAAGPSSSVDLSLETGDEIEIEERGADEVRGALGTLFTVPGTPVRNPAFDVTPAALVWALVTEQGAVLSLRFRVRRQVLGDVGSDVTDGRRADAPSIAALNVRRRCLACARADVAVAASPSGRSADAISTFGRVERPRIHRPPPGQQPPTPVSAADRGQLAADRWSARQRRCSTIRRESQIASRPITSTGTTRWPVSASTSSRSAAPPRHPPLLHLVARPPQRPRDAAARAEPVGRRPAAVEDDRRVSL